MDLPFSTTDRFSPRKRQVLAMLAEGLANKEIGYRLGIAEGTVKVYTYHIYKHSSCIKSRSDAVRYMARDAQRVQAIKLNAWIQKYRDGLAPDALAAIQQLMAVG